MSGTGDPSEWVQHAPHNAMDDPGEIERFYDRCSGFMRELLDALAASPDHPRCFPEIEDSIGWPRRRIASVLGGAWHLRSMSSVGAARTAFSTSRSRHRAGGRCGWTPRRRLPFAPRLADSEGRLVINLSRVGCVRARFETAPLDIRPSEAAAGRRGRRASPPARCPACRARECRPGRPRP